MGYRLGIDTGGTYTDAVLFDSAEAGTQQKEAWGVLKANKSLTTRHDLFEGIAAASEPVLDADIVADIELVSISTTLATNAIVEGLRPPVALIMIGFDEKSLSRGNLKEALQDDEVIFLKGGHRADGSQIEPLDLTSLKNKGFNKQVESVAIVGKFAVRNRAHEEAVHAYISEELSVPVTCSFELSQQLNGPLRAVTTLFNARLLPHLADLIRSTEAFLDQHKINAPLMIVQGDGSLVSAVDAVERPIETVLSGPAASLVGAWHLAKKHGSDMKQVCVSDMGGTTTDIGFLDNGRPRLADNGATVGGFKTHVRAVDMQTWGLGGDSEIDIQGGGISVGPRRAEPLCVAAEKFPSIIPDLKHQLDDLRPDLGNARFLRRFRNMEPTDLSKAETELWEAMATGPIPVRDYERGYAGVAAVKSLIRRGIALLISFTPTDASHVLGNQTTNNVEAAQLGANLLRVPKEFQNWQGCETNEQFAQMVVERTHQEVARVHLASALIADGVNPKELGDKIQTSVISAKPFKTISIRPQYAMPVVGVGAPAKLYYGEAANRIGTDFIDLPNADVCNAVGAVASGIHRTVSILITSPAEKVYRLHLPDGSRDIAEDLDLAREEAQKAAENLATEAALNAGACDIILAGEWKDKIVDIIGKMTFLEARITVEASGPPNTAVFRKRAA
ncbi:MAG: hydantoinase/oxoprolinase family protein [Alphaproteobacteria bacterium]